MQITRDFSTDGRGWGGGTFVFLEKKGIFKSRESNPIIKCSSYCWGILKPCFNNLRDFKLIIQKKIFISLSSPETKLLNNIVHSVNAKSGSINNTRDL